MIAELGSVAGRTIAIMRPELAESAYELRGGRRLLGVSTAAAASAG